MIDISALTKYSAAITSPAVAFDWIIALSWDDGLVTPSASGTYYFSGQNKNLDVFCHGNITSFGSIQESIDLIHSKGATSDLDFSLSNDWANSSGKLSAELFGGSKYFHNRNAKVYQWVSGVVALAEMPVIYNGRIKEIQHNNSEVFITLEKLLPSYLRNEPNSKNADNINVPIAYGDFVGNAYSAYAGTLKYVSELTSFDYRPVPFSNVGGNTNFISSLENNADTGNLAFYDDSLGVFIPITGSTALSTGADGFYYEYSRGNYRILWAFRITPFAHTNLSNDANITVSNIDRIYNSDPATFAQYSINKTLATPSSTATYTHEDEFDLKVPTGDDSQTQGELLLQVSISSIVGLNTSASVEVETSTGTTSLDYTASAGLTTQNVGYNSDDETIKIRVKFNLSDSPLDTDTPSINATIKIYDYSARVEKQKLIEPGKIDGFYSEINGLSQTYDGGSGYALRPHEVIRDIFTRFTGYDLADSAIDVNNGDTWSDIATDRDYEVRLWENKPKSIDSIIETIQKEFAIIFLLTATNMRVIYVKTSYASSNWTLSPQNANDFNVEITPISSLKTKVIYDYYTHPAKGTYLEQTIVTNTNRTKWGFLSDENILNEKFNYHKESAAVSYIGAHINNLCGTPKIIVSCDVVNNKMAGLIEVGDILDFENMVIEPFGDTWAGKYFMVTKTTKTPFITSVTCREVG